jgi:hypothetical protein
MPYCIYRYTRTGKAVDGPSAYSFLTDLEHSALEASVTERPGAFPLLQRMADAYGDCIVAHQELDQLTREIEKLLPNGRPELRAALAKLEMAATTALENDWSLLCQGD